MTFYENSELLYTYIICIECGMYDDGKKPNAFILTQYGKKCLPKNNI